GVLMSYYWAMNRYPNNIDHAQTIAFGTLCMSELLRAFTARSEHYGIFSIGVFSNKWMVWAVLGSAALVLLVIYLPILQPFFDTTSLSLEDWIHMVPFILMASVAAEITKVYIRKKAEKLAHAAAGA
ncbi:MAG: Calcium-transporting ATPase 1, partial [Deltaproteobacteria bacterium]|nr:Calcium-transporting ATPase 1 [Deltaproteobacteria bacterium]